MERTVALAIALSLTTVALLPASAAAYDGTGTVVGLDAGCEEGVVGQLVAGAEVCEQPEDHCRTVPECVQEFVEDLPFCFENAEPRCD